jgi:hypothetical protein
MAKSRSESAPRGACVKLTPRFFVPTSRDSEGQRQVGMTGALRGDSQRGNELCLARADAELDVVWDFGLVQIKEGTTVKNRTAQQDNGQPDNEAGLKQGLLKKMLPMTRAGEVELGRESR